MIKILHIVLIASGVLFNGRFIFADEAPLEGAITISGAWAIYPTVVAWAESFEKKYPEVKIYVSAGGAGKGAADAISGLSDIGMVSREPDPAEIEKGVTPIYILKDAIYPVISEKNPALDVLLKKGIKKDTLVNIYIDGTVAKWDAVVGKTVNRPIHVYTRSDSSGAAASWAHYLGKKQEDLIGVGIYGDPGILETVKRDPAGIGYSNFSFVFTKGGAVLPGLRLIPIDTNTNGIADTDEIYNNRGDAMKAIESNKYPTTRKNYFFVKGKPHGLVKDFINFALSEEGTNITKEVGTSLPLSPKDRQEILKTLP